jgi:hypothetical protein
MRVIGLDLHRVFAKAVMLDGGEVACLGRVGMTRERLEAFARKLTHDDHVVVEATGNAAAVAEVIAPLVGRVIIANPRQVRLIAEARVKTDVTDATVLARLNSSGFLPAVWVPNARSQVLRQQGGRQTCRESRAKPRWCMEPPWLGSWQLARATRFENSWTDGRDEARPVGWPSHSVVLEAHAVQIPRKPSPQVSQGEISGDELAGVRCCAGAAGKPDTLVHGRGRGGMACAGHRQARRPANLFGDSDRDRSRTSPGVPPAAASNRRPAVIYRQRARTRYRYP